MHNLKYTVVQDGLLLKDEVKNKFNNLFDYRDIRANNNGDYINFVGFILMKDEILVSFPKHYFSLDELSQINRSEMDIDHDINNIFSLIQKSIGKGGRYLFEVNKEINNSYPFDAFIRVYEYYKNYGFFSEDKELRKFGYNGKISWKDTFSKSPIVINNGNLLYMPPVIKKRVTDYVFISKCMSYVINSTLTKFPFIFKFPLVNLEYRDIDFTNTEKIMEMLFKIRNRIFKDIDVQLLDSLITYFKYDNKGKNYLQVKIYHFNLLWEEMVRKYLNDFFQEVSSEGLLVFDESSKHNNNFQKLTFKLDNREKDMDTYKIEPDYYYDDGTTKFIFDAKYYNQIDSLNYKQLSYYFLLRNLDMENRDIELVHNVMILPTAEKEVIRLHFDMKKEANRGQEFKMYEYYLNMKKTLRYYL